MRTVIIYFGKDFQSFIERCKVKFGEINFEVQQDVLAVMFFETINQRMYDMLKDPQFASGDMFIFNASEHTLQNMLKNEISTIPTLKIGDYE